MVTEQTVFVVDDDPQARSFVASVVASHGISVEAFASAEDFLGGYDRSKRGCLVVDAGMHGASGLELQEKLASEDAGLPVVVLSGDATVPMAVRAMKAGAVMFLEKPCHEGELWRAVRRALEEEDSRHRRKARRLEITSRIATLTDKETAVMNKMIEGRPNKQIAADLDIGLRTVELRRAAVLKKMKAGSVAELVRMTSTVDLPSVPVSTVALIR